ncbi:MAG: hypothetical protein RB296_02425 [Acidobacteriota bacterium]|jgi:hypothetical protein|nr:hypothetical protein [Acidobacteriota bacterium]
MKRMDELFTCPDMDHPLPVGFEDRVFKRIEACRRRRRVTAATAAVSAVLGFVFALALSLPRPSTQPVMQARHEIAPENAREVIPVVEDVIFATHDGRTHYAIEQVSFEDEAEF